MSTYVELKLYQYEKDIVEFLDRIQMFIAYQAQVYNGTSDLDVGQQAVDAIIFGDGFLKQSLLEKLKITSTCCLRCYYHHQLKEILPIKFGPLL